MSFLTQYYWGARGFIWLMLLMGIICLISVAIYWYRELIRKQYYKFRFPQKLLKAIVHYKSGLYKTYWRIIPDEAGFTLEGKNYNYSDKAVIKENEMIIKTGAQNKIVIEGKTYDLIDEKVIKKTKDSYPEIHFWYNISSPITFDFAKHKAEFSAKEQQDFKENDLFKKLLTLEQEKNLMMFLIIVCALNTIGIIFIIAKMMEWIK